jgi:pSer/pThr/pTyr-binding forkhead associated (FHA) protein
MPQVGTLDQIIDKFIRSLMVYCMDEKKLPSLDQSVFLVFNRQIIPLDKDIIRIGRQLDNDIVLNEEFVSRLHAEIRLEDGKHVLYDNVSTSGTFVNSQRIDRCVLNSGDLISMASIQIMFVNNNARLVDKARGTTQSLPKYGNKDK